ncbi:MAG TPA: NAD-dependent epimerase/dehydratase family protein [Edaphobacter sp.]
MDTHENPPGRRIRSHRPSPHSPPYRKRCRAAARGLRRLPQPGPRRPRPAPRSHAHPTRRPRRKCRRQNPRRNQTPSSHPPTHRIPPRIDLRHFDRDFALTNQLRTEGTRNLTTAAANAGVDRFIAQSFAGWPYARKGIRLKTEEDELDPDPPAQLKTTLDALRTLEATVLREPRFIGVVLRYGPLYGPHTSIALGGNGAPEGSVIEDLRHHKLPLIGQGTGAWSFLHIHDAATATVAALTQAQRGIYNIVDDDPALVSDWLPYLAECVGAKPPMHVPNTIAHMMVGEHAVALMNDIRGVSNEKAKHDLSWTPKWTSWRQGFREGLG